MPIADLNSLVSKLAAKENTKELETYWQQRYQELINTQGFILSQKTTDLLNSENLIDRPVTPFGELVLQKHLDNQGNLDEIKLQNSTETAVRLLDSCLDLLPLTDEAKFMVTQYRKIGLGIYDFSEFEKRVSSTGETNEIDKVGSLISSAAYRSSESLAFEKGLPTQWEQISFHLRPKTFEYWTGPDNQLYTGLELSEEYTPENIVNSGFNLKPRRNSHILLFPNDLEWQLWSDRDETSPITEMLPFTKKPIEIPENLDPNSIEEILENQNPQVYSEDLPDQEAEADEDLGAYQAEFNDSTDTDLSSFNNPELAKPETEKIEVKNLEGLESLTETELFPENETREADSEKNQSTELALEPKETTEIQLADNHKELLPISSSNEASEPENEDFEVGELVRVTDKKSINFGSILQVIEKIENPNLETRYILYGDGKPNKNLWPQKDLEAVDLDEILDLLNTNQQIPNLKINLITVYLNSEHTAVAIDSETEKLPLVPLLPTDDLYYEIHEFWKRRYEISMVVDQETAVSSEVGQDGFVIAMGFRVDPEDKLTSFKNLTWLNLEQLSKLSSLEVEIVENILDQELGTKEILEFNQEMQNQLGSLEKNSVSDEAINKAELEKELRENLSLELRKELRPQILQEVRAEILATEQVNKLEQHEIKKEILSEVLDDVATGKAPLDNSFLENPEVQKQIELRANQQVAANAQKLALQSSISTLKLIQQSQGK